MDIRATGLSARDAYFLMTQCIVPRPIAWVSSLSPEGIRNLAPFSYFIGVGSAPPMLAISVAHRKGDPKDTGRNLRETGEFVVNICPRSAVDRMVQSSAEYDAEVDEFAAAGLTPIDSLEVKPPGVAESPLRMECKVSEIVQPGGNAIDFCFGEIVCFRMEESILTDGKVDATKLQPVSRLGGQQYATLGDVWDIPRPSV